MEARAIWTRGLRSTNESVIINIREEKEAPAEGTRERSTPAPPEAEAPSGRHLRRTPPITLLRLAVKLICPDCVSALTKGKTYDRGPGIARPSTPSACPTDKITSRALAAVIAPTSDVFSLWTHNNFRASVGLLSISAFPLCSNTVRIKPTNRSSSEWYINYFGSKSLITLTLTNSPPARAKI